MFGSALHCQSTLKQKFIFFRQIEEKDILEIVSQMASAIRHMHEHEVLHRDLKTANIFLTKGQSSQDQFSRLGHVKIA